jgi:hypothetical protein
MVAGYMVYTRSTRSSQFSEGSIGKEAKLGFSYRGGFKREKGIKMGSS